ncbi:NYN domain-containing protein [Myxococcota bacterium]|nr:NYN domain-containing protein [Myxococcota bacterium]
MRSVSKNFRSLFDQTSFAMIIAGALDRKRAAQILSKQLRLAKGETKNFSHQEVVAHLVSRFWTHDSDAAALIREMDSSSRAEISIIQSVGLEGVEEKLRSLKALRLRRQGARLIWAMARDEREPVWTMAVQLMRDYTANIETLEEMRKSAKQKGLEKELSALEGIINNAADGVVHLETMVSRAEHERAELLAEIGRHQAALKMERQSILGLQKELKEAREKIIALVDESPASAKKNQKASERPKNEDERQIRQLTYRLQKLEDENRSLKKQSAYEESLVSENTRLLGAISRLKQESGSLLPRAMEQGVSSASPIAPPPTRSRSHKTAALKKPRVGLFVDVANIAGAARRLYKSDLEYDSLISQAGAGRQLSLARAYVIRKESGGKYERFASIMREFGYKVLAKQPKVFDDGTTKADWDVALVVDIMALCEKLDIIVLASGDGDFLPLVGALKAKGKRVELYAFKARASRELIDAVDVFVDLAESVQARSV